MSAAPKKGAHEEGVDSSALSMRLGFGGEGENPGFPRVNYGVVQETRPRPECHDVERRSQLHSVYKLPVSVCDAPVGGHPVAGPEIRAESRDFKDLRENKGVESNRDVKGEMREGQYQVVKPEESSEEGRNELKGEVKVDKDVYGVAGSPPNWKEQHRVQKHADVPSGGGVGISGMSGFWMGPHQARKYDIVKHANPTFFRKETDESVGENSVDLEGDKERKRKEGKHHDWSESDKDRSVHKNDVQVGGNSNNDLQEITREDKGFEQWGRENKDVLKEKERLEEREKNRVDREGRSGGEKEGYQNEKDIADKVSVQENFGLEQKKPPESWRNMEREAKERRRERASDLEGERPEKRHKGYDKESDKVGADVDVVFGSVVQQRKRMPCPRSSPQVVNRDGLVKPCGQDGKG